MHATGWARAGILTLLALLALSDNKLTAFVGHQQPQLLAVSRLYRAGLRDGRLGFGVSARAATDWLCGFIGH
jgi:hypothetical protein